MLSFSRFASGVASILLLSLLAGSSHAEERVIACRKAIGKAGTSFLRAILSAEQGCVERRLAGKLPPTAGCTDTGPSLTGVDDPATRDKIQKAIDRAHLAVTKKCTGLSMSAPANAGLGMPALCPSSEPACGVSVTDLTSLLDCVQCTHVSMAQALVGAPYGAGAVVDPPAGACRKAFGKTGAVLVTSVLTAEQACLSQSAKGKLAAGLQCSEAGWSIANITEPKTFAKLAAAITRARAAVEKRCTGVDVGAAVPVGLGLRTCDAAPACRGITVHDLPSLADCLECAHVGAAHELLAVQHADSTKPAAGSSSGDSPRRVSQSTGADASGCGSEAAPCRTIQYAVNASSSNDEILVAEGSYTYDVGLDPCAQYIGTNAVVCILNKRLTLRGGYAPGAWSAPDPAQHPTVIDGADLYRGVLVQRTSPSAPAAGIVMGGFTVRRGLVQGAASGGNAATFAFGAGMLVDSSPAEIRATIFRDNQAFGGNTTSAYGGAAAGGGLALRRASAGSMLEDLVFERNRAEGGNGGDRGGFGIGGGLFTFESTITAADLVFTGNLAIGGDTAGNGISGGEQGDGQGGGAAFQEGSDAVVSGVVASGNQATGGNAGTNAGGAFGGGLYAEKATLALTGADVFDNVALGGNGTHGGVSSGGGFMAQNAVVTIERGRMVDNRATGGSGSVTRGAGGGGGAYLSRFGSVGSGTIRNSIFADNLAQMGASGTPPGGGGGGLFLQGLPMTIDHVTVAENRLGSMPMQGTGIVILSGTSGANVTMRHSIIADHTTAGGAALHVQPGNSVTLVRGIYAGNNDNDNSDGSPDAAGTFTGLGTMLATGPLDFLSPGAPSFDYHIAASSPAVDQATGSTIAVDFDGVARTGTPDIGADEATP